MTRKDEAMQMLDQLEDVLKHYEQTVFEGGGYRSVTVRAYLILAKAVYWLMERWIRNNDTSA